jgi:hypothetical protein
METSITTGKLEWIDVSSLMVDTEYQRELSTAWVRKIAREFDPDVLGVLIVSRRDDGNIYVVDGQHRVAAIKEMGWGDQKVPCNVYEGLSLQDEAKIFWKPQTNRKYLAPGPRFRARLIHGDRDALRIRDIVEENGFTITVNAGGAGPEKSISAVAALEHVYNLGEAKLVEVMELIRDGYGDSGDRVGLPIIGGLESFCQKYRGHYDRERLVKILREHTMTSIAAQGADLARVTGADKRNAHGMVILKLYNSRLQHNRLPSWGDPLGDKS